MDHAGLPLLEVRSVLVRHIKNYMTVAAALDSGSIGGVSRVFGCCLANLTATIGPISAARVGGSMPLLVTMLSSSRLLKKAL